MKAGWEKTTSRKGPPIRLTISMTIRAIVNFVGRQMKIDYEGAYERAITIVHRNIFFSLKKKGIYFLSVQISRRGTRDMQILTQF